MDSITLTSMMELLRSVGVAGVVLLIWYVDHRVILRTLETYRRDVTEIKQLYENNAGLVRDYERTVARHERLFTETLGCISLNTQTLTRLVERIDLVLKRKDECA